MRAISESSIGKISRKVESILEERILEQAVPMVIAASLKHVANEQLMRLIRLQKQYDFLERFDNYIARYKTELRSTVEDMWMELIANVNRKSFKTAWFKYKDNFKQEGWLPDDIKYAKEIEEEVLGYSHNTIVAGGQYALDDLAMDIDFTMPPPTAVVWAAENAEKLGKSITNTELKTMRKVLKEAQVEGLSIPKIRNMLMDRMNMSKHRASMTARTEILKSSNRGVLEGFKRSGVVEGKQWNAAIDQRTCPECAEMDGVTAGPLDTPFFTQGESFGSHVFDYEDIQHPPLHVGCRCTLLAIVREF